jgi:hypothetical protein
MDRVLIACDQIQYANHVEMTLRKVGFEVEVMTTEFNLSEKLLTFNPDMIIVRGQSTKLSTMSIGKKIKDNLKYSGKVILILAQDHKISPEDLAKVKMDLLLFEPMGALRLTLNILNLDPERREMMQDRLLRMAEIDPNFRAQEQSYLVSYGEDLDRELFQTQGKPTEPDQDLLISENLLKDFDLKNQALPTEQVAPTESDSRLLPFDDITDEAKAHIKSELISSRDELQLRIETYNHQIKNIDQKLKNGLSRRQTNKQAKQQRTELSVDHGQEKLESLDREKQRFAQAMFKKK